MRSPVPLVWIAAALAVLPRPGAGRAAEPDALAELARQAFAPRRIALLIGVDHRWLTPATLLFGGAFLVLCDTLARTVIAPTELPVGILTALLGGPFFLWHLLSRSLQAEGGS